MIKKQFLLLLINFLALSFIEASSIGCDNTIKYDKRCDPYKSHLIYVDKKIIDNGRYIYNKTNRPKGISLQRVVERYIDYKEDIRDKILYKESKLNQSIGLCEYIYVYFERDRFSRNYKSFTYIAPYLISDSNKKSLIVIESFDIKKIKKRLVKKKRKRYRYKKKHKRKKKRVVFVKVYQILHKVKKGETLSHIAQLYHTTIEDIKDINDMGDDSFIKIGDILKIPSKNKIVLTQKKFNKIKSMMGTYKVEKGDSLGSLSKFFKVRISDIAFLNNFNRRRKLKIGEKILLPLTQDNIDNLVDVRRIERELAKRDAQRRARLKKLKAYSKKLKYLNNQNFKHKIRVIATAYTSHERQTDKTPFLAAWNNPIRPGMKVIAVSPDLIRKYGLTNGIKVKISGLKGIYTVRDKMNKKLKNHIDIYMGTNIRKALRWGRRRVVLYW